MNWLAAALGGALGALARYAVAMVIPFAPGKFPVATLLVNILGCLFMGIFYVALSEKMTHLTDEWRLFLIVGFLGALTTFSTFALEAILLWQHNDSVYAAAYLVTSVIGCIGATWLGLCVARMIL